ncbi:MAG: major facilitator superfamily protein [bacterium]|nr:MAG: major facilitator superfamily protein [bacterium]
MSTNNKREPRFFYGWLILGACFLTTTMVGGLFYSFGIFFKPLLEEFGWSRALTSSVSMVHLWAFAFSSILLGRLIDRYGPKVVLAGSAVLIGLGYSLCSQVNSIFQLYLFYIIAALGSGATWVLPTSTVQRWFIKRRGLTLAVVTTGIGLGALIFAPIINHLIFTYGWRKSYIILGILSWLVLTVVSTVMVLDPEKKGLKPYGAEESAPNMAKQEKIGHDSTKYNTMVSTAIEWGFGEAIRTKTFWGLVVLYMFALFPIYMLATHIVPHAIDMGISEGVAAGALGLIGATSIAGRLMGGAIAERFGWTKGMALSCFLSGASVIHNVWMLYVFVITYGLFYGARVPQLPGIVGFFFGSTSLASLIGLCHGLAIFGSAEAPIVAGFIYDKTGSYTVAFLIAGIASLIAGALALFLKPPKKRVSTSRDGEAGW